jgi:hypothetical protein
VHEVAFLFHEPILASAALTCRRETGPSSINGGRSTSYSLNTLPESTTQKALTDPFRASERHIGDGASDPALAVVERVPNHRCTRPAINKASASPGR